MSDPNSADPQPAPAEQPPSAAYGPPLDEAPQFDYSPHRSSYTPYAQHERVRVFYRFQQDPTDLWFPTPCAMAGIQCPRMGFSDGWTTAEVMEDFHPERLNEGMVRQTGVRVRYTHPHWYNRRGYSISPDEENMTVECVHPCQVRRLADLPSAPEPEVSFVVVRWGGEKQCDEVKEGHGGWGRTGSAVSDPYIKVIFEETIWPTLGPSYEVFSVFIRCSEDLARLNAATIVPLLRGRHKVAMYFLWPVVFQDNLSSPGYVNQAQLLGCMQNFEACGLTTRYPHHSHLYRLLITKEWASYLSWAKEMMTPPTTKVPRALIVHDPLKAAGQAIAAIQKIRCFRDGAVPTADPPRGVAKLGSSWEAADVRVWSGAPQLAYALKELGEQPSSQVESVMVQDWCDFDIEIRLFWVEAELRIDPQSRALRPVAPRTILYTKFNAISEERRMRYFERFQRAAAIERCFAGDEPAMADAERQAVALGQRLLLYLTTECCEPIPVLRMDFMIKRTGPGTAAVWAGELTELGGCFLGWSEGPELIWGAVLRSCFREECGHPQCRCKAGAWPPPYLTQKKPEAEGWRENGPGGAAAGLPPAPAAADAAPVARGQAPGGGGDEAGGAQDGGEGAAAAAEKRRKKKKRKTSDGASE